MTVRTFFLKDYNSLPVFSPFQCFSFRCFPAVTSISWIESHSTHRVVSFAETARQTLRAALEDLSAEIV